jgi:LCP family protein required for cell wall assembly
MPPVLPPGSQLESREHERAARIRFRRAVTLMVMTLLLPGSAQLVAGNRKVGRIALRITILTIGIGLFLLLLSLAWHDFALRSATNPLLLGLLRLIMIGLALGWAGLFVDAWRLGQPLSLIKNQRLVMVGINGLLTFSVAGTLLFGAHLVGVHRAFIVANFGDGHASSPHDGRYNVLLLGGDSGAGRDGMRPDSITVASIDEETGQTVLFGLPRNMLNFTFAKGSVMAEQFPDGYDCGTECELNSLSTWANDHKSLFPEDGRPAGVQATIDGVEGITGLKINYYAQVNLEGFKKFVTAMGGLTLNVRDRIPIGRIGKIEGYVEPGIRKLNGYETLWYARSRAAADDYSRMARQKCVLNAMLQQLTPGMVIRKYQKLTEATAGLIETDLPASELAKFAELALDAKAKPVRTVSFVPPAVSTSHPDIDKIHDMVDKALTSAKEKAKKKVKPAAPKEGFTRDKVTTQGASKGSYSSGYSANEATDLGSAC